MQLESGKGPEASARDARYAALHAEIESGDWLLSAHHREDQAETLLLNLVRGSGPAGLAGIGPVRRFGAGWALRQDWEVVAIASQANIGGGTSALALARSFDRPELFLPAILVGSLGTAGGTYLGFFVAGLLGAPA